VANRICPVCGKEVPAALSVAYSNGLDCPHCHSRLDVVEGSRMLPIWGGLAAALLAYELTKSSQGILNFVLPELYAILAFGFVTPLLMMFTAKMEPAPPPPAAVPASAAPSHGHH
jgi:hypothetical protein